MQSVALGATGVTVSPLGFGAAPIGNLYRAVDDRSAAAAVDAAWEAGLRYFDTAPHYGLGLSERRLGRALAGRPRPSFAVSTKVGRLLRPNPSPTGSDLAAGGFDVPDDLHRVPDYSATGVRRSVEESLTRLGLDRLDVVLVHDPDDHVDQAVDEAVPALAELRSEGVIGAIGVGMNHVQPLRRFVAETDVDVVMVAGRWTLVDRTAAPLLDEARARGVAVLAAAPFNSGLLARPDVPDDARLDYAVAPPELVRQLREVARALAEHGVSLPQAALQFPRRDPAVSAVVVGIADAEQAGRNAANFAASLAPEAWDVVDALLEEVIRR